MCNELLNNEEYINYQTGEVLDLERVSTLPDNAMLKVRNDLWCEWDFEKNEELGHDIWKIAQGSGKKTWWYCLKYDDSYPMPPNKKIDGDRCSICNGYYIVRNNSFGHLYPELASEWHPTLNGDLTPFEFSRSTGKVFWWKCKECPESYDTSIDKKVNQKAKCPYCRGLRVGKYNNFKATHPQLAEMWDYEKNEGKLPEQYIKGNKKDMFYWKCKMCGHASYSNIANKSGCSVCAGQSVLKGFNDMWTTNPELAKLLSNPEDGYKYMQWSNQKTNWKCPCCGEVVKDKKISDINKNGFKCNICSDGFSFGERVIYKILSDLTVDFDYQKKFDWSMNRLYDFFLIFDSEKIIIEVQGEQHRNGSFSKLGGRSLLEEESNDKIKKELAMKNGISHYIVLNIDTMNLHNFKKEIISSPLMEILNIKEYYLKDFKMPMYSTIANDCWLLWNEGFGVMAITNKLKINKATTRKYLKLGNELSICKYSTEDRYKRLNRDNKIG